MYRCFLAIFRLAIIEYTPPFTDEVVLWHFAFDSEQHFLLLMMFLESKSVYDGFTTVAALQRSRVVQDFDRCDVCREVRDEACMFRSHLERLACRC